MNNSTLLQNQVAIITGAGRGIGRATALAFAQAGASVVLAARSADELTGVADEIRHQGGAALAIPTDVSDTGQVDYLLVLTLRAFGQVDILINNAAVFQPAGRVWETAPGDWHRNVAINLLGPYLCARTVLPHMLERGSGRIINLSSGVADRNIAGMSAYSASKAALERLSGVMAQEVAGQGIDVTVLRPGVVDTPMQSQIRQSSAQRVPQVSNWRAYHHNGQLRPPAEVAQAIFWLASPFASGNNGQVFELDDLAFRQRLTADLGLPLLPGRDRN